MAIKQSNHRVTCTLTSDEYERLKYWADKNEMSVNEYIREAVESAIKKENGDYDLPTLETKRLNQLVDIVTVLNYNMKELESTVIHYMDSLLNLTRGDNYLLEQDEDGEI